MNARHGCIAALGATVLLACARGELHESEPTRTDAPPPASPPSDAATPPHDGGVDAARPPPPEVPEEDVLDVPRTKSAHPTEKQWAAAEASSIGADCELALVREWARIRCGALDPEAGGGGTNLYASVVLLAGSRTDVSAAIDLVVEDAMNPQNCATIELRLRPGDRRVFQLNAESAPPFGYDPTPRVQTQAVTISETWLTGAEGPSLVLDSGP